MEDSFDGIQWELVERAVLVLLELPVVGLIRSSGIMIGDVGSSSLIVGNCSYCVFGYFFFDY